MTPYDVFRRAFNMCSYAGRPRKILCMVLHLVFYLVPWQLSLCDRNRSFSCNIPRDSLGSLNPDDDPSPKMRERHYCFPDSAYISRSFSQNIMTHDSPAISPDDMLRVGTFNIYEDRTLPFSRARYPFSQSRDLGCSQDHRAVVESGK